MSTSASVKALLNKFVDLRFEEDPFSCAPFGIRRFEDCFPDLGKAAMMDMREKLLELQSETREVASLPDLTSSEIADVAFLLDVIDSSLVTTGIPGEVGYAYELQNNHMTSIFSALEMVFQHYQRDDTREDLENYRKRLILTGPQFDNMIDGFRSGISRKITLNRDGVEMMIKKFSDSCGGFGTEEDNLDDSTAFARKSPLNKSEKALALTGDVDFLVPAIRDVVMKGYARARKFLEEEYLPHARQYPGIYGLPDYERQYANYVFTNTNVRYTASEIHELGLKEVARIEALMNQAKADCGFEGSLHEFHLALNDREKYPQLYFDSVDEVLPEYNRICQKAKEKMVDYFEVFPKFDCSVQAVPEFLEAQMPLALYMAGTPTKPGTFMANLRLHKVKPLHEKTALCLHEANPGHHHQISLSFENENLHLARRLVVQTSYAEGWGLYCEFLGEEMGFYTDPFQYFGRLELEMFRAIRLVVDSGLHAKGWSIDQAADYMLSKVSMSRDEILTEVRRYCVIPGQALAYKVGEIKIKELRKYAEAELGPLFDIKKFHSAVIDYGSVPLGTLETIVKKWVETVKGK